MTKCPYVPPHPWNVDFPHLMLRAKAVHSRKDRRERCATRCSPRPMSVGSIAGIPVVAEIVNAVNRPRPGASCSRRRSACIATRRCPSITRTPLASACARRRTATRRRGEADRRRPAARSCCSPPATATATSPSSDEDLVADLRAQRHPGDDRAQRALLRHAEARARRSRSGRAAQGTEHSGAMQAGRRGLGHRHADSLLHADVQAGAAADVPGRRGGARCATRMFDPFEYLMLRAQGRAAAHRLPEGSARSATTCRVTCACRTSA